MAGKGDWKTGVTMADVNGDGFWIYMFARLEIIRILREETSYSSIRETLHSKMKQMNMDLIFRVFQLRQLFLTMTWMEILICIFSTILYIQHAVMACLTLRFEKDSLAGDRLYRNDVVNGKRFFTDVTDASRYLQQSDWLWSGSKYQRYK